MRQTAALYPLIFAHAALCWNIFYSTKRLEHEKQLLLRFIIAFRNLFTNQRLQFTEFVCLQCLSYFGKELEVMVKVVSEKDKRNPTSYHRRNKPYIIQQEGQDGPVSLHWLIREIHSYQTLHYLGIGLKHKTPYMD